MTADGLNDEIARQRDRAQASLRDRDAQLSKTERCLRIERQEAAAAIRVLREDAEFNARCAELAEQKLAGLRRDLRMVTEERNRLQVSEREACELAAALARLRDRDDTVHVESELLQSDRGIFVPIHPGHMLSVTVTPYYPEPVDAEVVSE